MGDNAYSSAANHSYLRERGITAVIPVKEDKKKHRRDPSSAGGRPPAFDAGRYKERNTVERCFAKLKRFHAWTRPLSGRANRPVFHCLELGVGARLGMLAFRCRSHGVQSYW